VDPMAQAGVVWGLGVLPLVVASLGTSSGRLRGVLGWIGACVAVSAGLHAAFPDAVGINEVWWTLLCGLVGLGLGLGAPERSLVGRLVGVALFLVVAEGGLRMAGETARPDEPALWAGPRTWSFPCLLPYMATPPEDDPARPRPRVVHLGDSMTQGPGPREDTFVGRLDAGDPTRTHLRIAMAGTGPDCALFILRQLPAVDAVFVHLFPGNDAPNLGYRYPWCDEQPLVDFDAEGVPTTCPDAPRAMPPWRRVPWDPAPFAWRRLASTSALANVLLQRLWEPLPHWLGTQDLNDGSMQAMFHRADRVVGALVAEGRRRGVPVYATLLPWEGIRPDARYREELHAHTEAWRGILARHGVPTLDLIDLFDGTTDPPVPGIFASDDPPDPHFGPEGFRRVHAAMAPWVTRRLSEDGVPQGEGAGLRPPPALPEAPPAQPD